MREIIKPYLIYGDRWYVMAFAPDPAPRHQRFHAVRDWLQDARSALRTPAAVSGMSENQLRDIGLKPRSLTSTVYRELGRNSLVDFNWRQGR